MAVTAWIRGSALLGGTEDSELQFNALGIGFILAAVALTVGFLTPLASGLLILLVSSAAFWGIHQPGPTLFDGVFPGACTVVTAVCVAILGPGEYSIDARLFGRRKIIIPKLPSGP